MMKENINQVKKETAVKNFRYNRFLMLRYLSAGFFFSNLYWILSLVMSRSFCVIVPLSLAVLSIPAIAEHLRLYGYPSDDVRGQLKWHRLYQSIQQLANIPLIVAVLADVGFERLFPFLKVNMNSKRFVVVVLLAGILLSEIIIRKINRIYKQRDKHASYMAEFSEFNE